MEVVGCFLEEGGVSSEVHEGCSNIEAWQHVRVVKRVDGRGCADIVSISVLFDPAELSAIFSATFGIASMTAKGYHCFAAKKLPAAAC